MELDASCLVGYHFNALFDSLLEACVLEEDERLGWPAGREGVDVWRSVGDEQEAEYVYEELNVFLCEGWNELSELMPSKALARDEDVAQELVKLLLGFVL